MIGTLVLIPISDLNVKYTLAGVQYLSKIRHPEIGFKKWDNRYINNVEIWYPNGFKIAIFQASRLTDKKTLMLLTVNYYDYTSTRYNVRFITEKKVQKFCGRVARVGELNNGNLAIQLIYTKEKKSNG